MVLSRPLLVVFLFTDHLIYEHLKDGIVVGRIAEEVEVSIALIVLHLSIIDASAVNAEGIPARGAISHDVDRMVVHI
jgi:hypothetical protein